MNSMQNFKGLRRNVLQYPHLAQIWKLSLPASKFGQIGTVAIFDHRQV